MTVAQSSERATSAVHSGKVWADVMAISRAGRMVEMRIVNLLGRNSEVLLSVPSL